MIVVDTNVLSEVMKPVPSGEVVRWMAACPPSTLFTTTITLGEVLFGLKLVPAGRRREAFRQAIDAMFEERFAGRILPFDRDAARAFADISAKCRRLGRPIGELDAQIAGIALSQGAAIATRNVGDFADCGVELIDPWSNKTRSDKTRF
jgi:predicted nucleic acid-binding protein